MANNKKEITSQDVLNLVEAKARDPRISMADIFRKVDSVRPNNNREMWKWFWIPLLFFALSVFGMLFIPQNTAWNRLSIIVFVISSCLGCYILNKFEKKWRWVIPLDILIVYVVFSESLSLDELVKLIKESL